MARQRRVVHFAGTVQGVGFRYTAIRVARHHDVTGRVRNLRDGRVEVVVEGEGQEIDAFLGDVQERMRGYIRDTAQQLQEPTGEFGDFNVAF